MTEMLSVHEARVIGCLIEKQITTPDQYPLSLSVCDHQADAHWLLHDCQLNGHDSPRSDWIRDSVRESPV